MSKYFALALIGARRTLASRAELVARMGFFAILLLIFSRLWEVVISKETALGWSASQMVWYLALTEWVVLSVPELYQDLEQDVRTGDLGYHLPRPISYFWSRFAEGLGRLAVRLMVNGALGFVLAWFFAGELPASGALFLWAIPVGIVASVLFLLTLGIIGLLASWLQDVQPVYWVWQKAIFVMGGLILPLDIYPDWLRTTSEYTPFAGMLYGTGRWALASDLSPLSWTALNLGIWLTVFLFLARWLERRSLIHINRTGA